MSTNGSFRPDVTHTSREAFKGLILIVDDLPTNLKVLRGLLADTGHKLTFARSGRQALERVKLALPDLILLDLMMPEMNGLEVCRYLKQSPQTASIPIIFLTASHEREHLLQAFEQGAVDYVTKPFQPGELLARIKTHLTLVHLQKRTQRQAAQETILRHVIEDIHSSLELTTVLANAISHIQAFMVVDRILIVRCLASAQKNIVATTDPACQLANFPIDTARFKDPYQLSIAQPETLTSVDVDWLKQWQVHTELRFPIFQDDKLWGAMIIHLPAHLPQDGSADLLQLIVGQLEIAIQQSELYAELQVTQAELVTTVEKLALANTELAELAHVDKLTQLANRRYFDTCMKQEWLRLQREKHPLSVIVIDIDYFKPYNDTYGHLQGDNCLQAVAQALSQTIQRPADLMFRYGGEEFVAVLPNTYIEGAVVLAEKMQQAISQLDIPHHTSLVSNHITISLGIATRIPNPQQTWTALIDEADKALYRAKERGRNQYCLANDLND
ncbi:MAG: diguanylate cyclase domain-containing protein [Leptolyngbyaceae cyanobacterium]